MDWKKLKGVPAGLGDGDDVGWFLTGNAAINPATRFIGTTDAQPLQVRAGNINKMVIGLGQSISTHS